MIAEWLYDKNISQDLNLLIYQKSENDAGVSALPPQQGQSNSENVNPVNKSQSAKYNSHLTIEI